MRPLKEYLNHFYDTTVHIHTPDKEMFMDAFIKRLWANPFNKSLISNQDENMQRFE